jgi:hypothetical protein
MNGSEQKGKYQFVFLEKGGLKAAKTDCKQVL